MERGWVAHRVVFGAAAEDPDAAPDFLVATDDGVQHRHLGRQVCAVLLQRLEGLVAALAVDGGTGTAHLRQGRHQLPRAQARLRHRVLHVVVVQQRIQQSVDACSVAAAILGVRHAHMGGGGAASVAQYDGVVRHNALWRNRNSRVQKGFTHSNKRRPSSSGA